MYLAVLNLKVFFLLLLLVLAENIIRCVHPVGGMVDVRADKVNQTIRIRGSAPTNKQVGTYVIIRRHCHCLLLLPQLEYKLR